MPSSQPHCPPARAATLLVLLLLASPARADGPADPLQERLDLSERYLRIHEYVRDTYIRPQWLGSTESMPAHGSSWMRASARPTPS
jgi:hypothetical protein